MKDFQRANLKKALTEVGMFAIMCFAQSLMSPDDEDEYGNKINKAEVFRNRNWFENQAFYQIARLKADLGVMLPWWSMGEEVVRFVEHPTPVWQYLQDLLKALDFRDAGEKLKSGPNKDMDKE